MTAPRPLGAPASPPPRYSQRALPSYRHVPGLTPHPVRDPGGHAWGIPESPPSAGCVRLPAAWRRCEEYLLGVDLFNRGFFWEAHEAWEVAWNAAGPESRPGMFLQGLIQCSAALLKRHLEVPRGARRLASKAATRFERAFLDARASPAESALYMGLRVALWRDSFEAYLTGASESFPFLELTGT